MVKFREILNKKINSRNNQISFDLKKKKFRELDLDIDEFLDMEFKNKLRRFKSG